MSVIPHAQSKEQGMLNDEQQIIINFTPTGIIPTKDQTPYVPVSVAEIVEDVRQAYDLGISLVHLHARDQAGKPTHQKEIYAQIIQGIRSFAPELIICVSTSGRVLNTFESRSEVLELSGALKPDMASLTLSSLNFNHTASINDPEMIFKLAKMMKDQGILPEIEIFDLGMINYLHYLIRKGVMPNPYYVNFILGNIASAQVDLLHVGTMIKDLPEDSYLCLGAVGRQQRSANQLSMAMGYGIRVGLEDNIWLDDQRTQLATNIDLLKRVHAGLKGLGKSVMSSSTLRTHLNLHAGHGHYGLKV
jgi:3-keto-5-aminohexanoate cleavage enzyme